MMPKTVLIIGGYGNFGRLISRCLAQDEFIQIIIAGRSLEKANELATQLKSVHPVRTAFLDVTKGLDEALRTLAPDIVIHTSGPFQGQGYDVAKSCINNGIHYIDLADAREFVTGIEMLDAAANEKGVLVCSGASSVPCLTSCLIEAYLPFFKELKEVDYAITTAQKTGRGLATVRAVLSYAGQRFTTLQNGQKKFVYGWLDLRFRKFWGLGFRGLGNCDIPDLDIFPKRYPSLKTIRFQAGLELKVLQLGLWGMSLLRRVKLFPRLSPLSPFLLKVAAYLDVFGDDNSGFYMTLKGVNSQNALHEVTFELLAKGGDGLYIPCMPAIILGQKLARGQIDVKGAMPCVGLITKDEYLTALKPFAIEWRDNMVVN